MFIVLALTPSLAFTPACSLARNARHVSISDVCMKGSDEAEKKKGIDLSGLMQERHSQDSCTFIHSLTLAPSRGR